MNLELKMQKLKDILLSCEKDKFFNTSFMDKVDGEFKKIGFKYVALDLKGYRTGSMNEVL